MVWGVVAFIDTLLNFIILTMYASLVTYLLPLTVL